MDHLAPPLPPGAPLPATLVAALDFLDAALPTELRQAAAEVTNFEPRGAGLLDSKRNPIARWALHTFRLEHPLCPLREAFAAYRIHHHKTMAHALALAFCLRAGGRDPRPAFEADYAIDTGLLSWEPLDRLSEASPESTEGHAWHRFRPLYRPGDGVVRSSTPGGSSYLLVRGDRLVAEHEILQMKTVGTDHAYLKAHAAFLSAGGYAEFFRRGPAELRLQI